MSATVAHQGLRYLIRASASPEVTTNDLLQALFDADRGLRAAFLHSIATLSGQDLTGARIEREAYAVDEVTGKQSYRDFRISRDGRTPCIIETKVDSALTSQDQASRYLAQVDPGGTLIFVTRAVLARALAVQVAQQLDIALPERGGVHRGVSGGRAVVVLSWRHLLRAVVAPDGRPYEELLAVVAALEDISDFVPFTAAARDTAAGRLVSQVADVAEELCGRLGARLDEAGVKYDSVGRIRSNGKAVWMTVTILQHEMWVGYDADYWAMVPGDPDHEDAMAPTAAPPSPFWVDRYSYQVKRAYAEVVAEQRARLAALNIARPLQAPLGAPFDAVVDTLLEQAVEHLGAISKALHADPAAVYADTTGLPAADEGDPGAEASMEAER